MCFIRGHSTWVRNMRLSFKHPCPLHKLHQLSYLQSVRLLGCAAKDHRTVLIAQRSHPAHALNDVAPQAPRVTGHVDGAHGPVAAEHDARGTERGEDDAEPAQHGLEDAVGVLVAHGLGELREAPGQLHVDLGRLAEGVDGGAPGVEGGVGGDVVDGEVGLAEVIWDYVSKLCIS